MRGWISRSRRKTNRYIMPVKGLYGFDENTMEYLHAFKYKDALMQAFIDKRPYLSGD